MSNFVNQSFDYERPARIAEGVYWVGVYNAQSKWLSSPYLIVDGGEAVLIDGGSRHDFASVVMKIMQAGVLPSSIVGLIYQNYNPRLWGSLQHLEVIIDRDELKIISDRANLRFIQHHSEKASMVRLDEIGYRLRLSSGRCLDFIGTPFAHSAGSFVTFDRQSGILFSGDLFSSYAGEWNLHNRFKPGCRGCAVFAKCPDGGESCALHDILKFHRDIMSSERALKSALDRIASLPFKMIAPQHGSIISESDDIILVCEKLSSLKGVGIDGIIGERSFFELGNTSPIRERLSRDVVHGSH